jgi:alpha-galactosidase
MEFLNNTRNPQIYGNDALAPARYRPDTLFATVMFSNPLGWFETSNLPPEFVEEVSALTHVWKRERPAMFAGHITPIGHAPDGHAWTGFTSVSPDSQAGHLLVFRELNANPDWSFDLGSVGLKPGRITPLGGRGSAAINGNLINIRIPQTLDFLWLRLD